jgi:hypothetical protein
MSNQQKLTEGSHRRAYNMPREVRTDSRGDNLAEASTGKGKREHGAHGKCAEYVKPLHEQNSEDQARKSGQ